MNQDAQVPTEVGEAGDLDQTIDLSRAQTRSTPRGELREPEHADYLAAIWIMASNDEVPIVTYKGIAFRLGIDEAYARSLVASRPELFRLRVPTRRLREWKSTWTRGRGPSWVKELPPGPERNKVIEDLKEEDCFRSQFRAEDGAARSGLDVIEWGLKHLDRVRSTMVGHDEGIAKSWQMVLAIGLALLGIVAQIVIAAAKSR